jgi:hypothetical protein
MRTTLCTLGLVGLVSLVACGGLQKRGTLKDPDQDDKKQHDDDTPKWEGASVVKDQPDAPEKAGGGPAVHEAAARSHDKYDKEATEVVLKRSTRQVKDNCGAAKDENGKATGPWGKVNLQIILGHNGHSKTVTVPAPYQGKPVGNCIEMAFTNLSFPPWAGADTQIDWEVELVQPK